MVSSKTVSDDFNLKFTSKFNHGFTNHGCLQCAILKALCGFKEKKSPQGKTCSKWDCSDFKNV